MHLQKDAVTLSSPILRVNASSTTKSSSTLSAEVDECIESKYKTFADFYGIDKMCKTPEVRNKDEIADDYCQIFLGALHRRVMPVLAN